MIAALHAQIDRQASRHMEQLVEAARQKRATRRDLLAELHAIDDPAQLKKKIRMDLQNETEREG